MAMFSCWIMMSLQICNVFLLLPAMAINARLSPTPSGHMHQTYVAFLSASGMCSTLFLSLLWESFVGGKCLSHTERIMQGIMS